MHDDMHGREKTIKTQREKTMKWRKEGAMMIVSDDIEQAC